MSDDPRRSGRFKVSDIEAASKRERRAKLIKDLEMILLIWCVGGLLWLIWEWRMG